MTGSASLARAAVVAFGLWKVVGTFFLGLTVDRLRTYVERDEILGVAKQRIATIGLAAGFTAQAGLSLLHASYRWVG